MLDWIKTSLLDQSQAIAASPAVFTMAVLVTTAIAWLILRWAYSSRIDNLNDLLRLRDGQIDDYKQKLSGATPDEARARMTALEAQIEKLLPRSISPAQANSITAAAASAGKFRISVIQDMACPDAKKLSGQLAAALAAAGWDVLSGMVMGLGNPPKTGIALIVHFGAPVAMQDALMRGLKAADIEFDVQSQPAVPQGSEMPGMELLVTSRLT